MATGNISVIVAIFITLLLNTCKTLKENSLKTTIKRGGDLVNVTILNFTDFNTSAFENWIEVSDGGRSKATLVKLKGQNYQSGIFFYLLTPQKNGPSFAGIHRIVQIDVLPAYDGVIIDLHRQGPHSHFRLFYSECSDTSDCVSCESVFKTSGEREQVKIPLHISSAYLRGRPQSNSKFSGLTQKSHIGIKVNGGSNEPENQYGPGSIEIFTI
uniref:NADH:ubiquinone oxidoreductase intermediate-associated protein 30 domain-containing protein n=1 Tax=Schistosoma mattheei TaxID=31246 RepID=A0AA85BM17_9TREM